MSFYILEELVLTFPITIDEPAKLPKAPATTFRLAGPIQRTPPNLKPSRLFFCKVLLTISKNSFASARLLGYTNWWHFAQIL